MASIELGKDALYVENYSPELLEPIARSKSRESLFRGEVLPFGGVDFWTSYELSWLNPKGVPQVAIVEFAFPCTSENIIESKSFKYYLNSFNQTAFTSSREVRETLIKDLSNAAGATVLVSLYGVEEFRGISALEGTCVDQCDIEVNEYQPSANLLKADFDGPQGEDALYSHLLKSNCPVTGQPDWATIWVKYCGPKIAHESFLEYVISFRKHQDFHENCVEQIFKDITDACKPHQLTVYARYTRRGGLDINPFRTNCGEDVPLIRVSRQ